MVVLWLMHFGSSLVNMKSYNKEFFDDDFFQLANNDNADTACTSVYRPAMEQFKTNKNLWVI